MRATCVLLLLLLVQLAPLGAAATRPDDDAGTGIDAGENMGAALAVTLGTYHGSIPNEDGWRDTYKVAVPADHFLRVVVTSEDCWLYFADPVEPWVDIAGPSYGAPIQTESLPFADGFAYFVLDGCGGYTFTASIHESPEFHAARLSWEEVPVRTVAGETGFSLLRRVTATVENKGVGNAPLTLIIEERHGEQVRRIATRALPGLAPGTSYTFSAPWDQTGQFGDGVLRLRVVAPLDPDPRNNVLEMESFVIVGGIGVGADLLNQRAVVPVLPVLVSAGAAHVGVYHHEGRVGLYVARYTHNFFTDYSASEWVRVEVSESRTPSIATCFRSTFDACPDPAP